MRTTLVPAVQQAKKAQTTASQSVSGPSEKTRRPSRRIRTENDRAQSDGSLVHLAGRKVVLSSYKSCRARLQGMRRRRDVGWSEARGQALEIDGKCPKPASGSEMNVVDKPLAHIPRRTGVWASWRAAWLVHCCSPKMDHGGQKRNNGGSQPDRSNCIRARKQNNAKALTIQCSQSRGFMQ